MKCLPTSEVNLVRTSFSFSDTMSQVPFDLFVNTVYFDPKPECYYYHWDPKNESPFVLLPYDYDLLFLFYVCRRNILFVDLQDL